MDKKEFNLSPFGRAMKELLIGTLWSIRQDTLKGIIFIESEEKFREAITKIAFNTLNMPIEVVLNDIPISYSEFAPVEKVNHPSHYGGKDNPYEVIKVMEEWLTYEEFIGAMKFQQFKYLARAKKKDTEDENYEKSTWYANYLIDYIRRRHECGQDEATKR